MQTDTTLLLAAHGSSRPGGDNPVRRLAEQLKAQDIFADVRCGFLKEPPLLQDVLTEVRTRNLTVVPMLTGHGYITDELIPQALEKVDANTLVKLCQPIGADAKIPEIMAERAKSVILGGKLKRDRVSIMVAAHGNAKNPENARQTKELANRIRDALGGIPVMAGFIEEPPLISDWPGATTAEDLIVLPFLVGGGLHGAEDVPAMLGLDAQDPRLLSLDENTPYVGPLSAQDRSIWYCRALGHEPALADIIIDIARASLG